MLPGRSSHAFARLLYVGIDRPRGYMTSAARPDRHYSSAQGTYGSGGSGFDDGHRESALSHQYVALGRVRQLLAPGGDRLGDQEPADIQLGERLILEAV